MLWNYLSCLHCCLQRRTPEVFSAGFVADRYPPLPLLYLISTFTQHFIFSRTNKKKKSHLSSNTEPELLSLPPTLQGKPCSQERCFSHFPGGLTSSEKTLAGGMQSGGDATRRAELQLFGLSCLDNIPHRIASAAWFNS